MFGIWPRRSTPPERGLRVVLPCRRQMISFFDRQGVGRVVDRLTTDVGVFEAWGFHGSQLVGNLLGRKALSQQVGDQLE